MEDLHLRSQKQSSIIMSYFSKKLTPKLGLLIKETTCTIASSLSYNIPSTICNSDFRQEKYVNKSEREKMNLRWLVDIY